MTLHIAPLTETVESTVDSGLGALHTERGNLPLESIEASVAITGLVSRIELTQRFRNPHDIPLEATYIFPLPDRAAVNGARMVADDRVIEAELKERGQARREYDQAIAGGRRASIAEEERPDVFTMRVGNILPAEQVTVTLTLVGPLSYEDGEATFRLPLVVAPRFIPGTPTGTAPVGEGYAPDSDAVPDASRITPPVLLPGFPQPVRLAIEVDIDAAGLPLGEVRSSLHAVVGEGNHVSIRPGERANRDFILRLSYGQPEASCRSLTLTPDSVQRDPDLGSGTFRLTILPPTAAVLPRPRDVVLLLDRSGSMQGWKMVAARRAAARIVDTLAASDRFAVLAFDNTFEYPPALGPGLHDATDRHRFRAVEHLAQLDARGGTVLMGPMIGALDLLTDGSRDRVLVLVTDGQVGNEDEILTAIAGKVAGVRLHAVGIDQAVNAGFLGRLAAAGAGRCELVESEDRLDEAMERIHRRIGAPVVTGLTLTGRPVGDGPAGEGIVAGTTIPGRLPDLFPGAPLVVTGRYRGALDAVDIAGSTRDGAEFAAHVTGTVVADPALTALWARAHLRDLDDRYASGAGGTELEERLTARSLAFGVLCRFTAWLAVDTRIVTDGGRTHRVIQPVEAPAGWDMFGEQAGGMVNVVRLAAAVPMAQSFPRPTPDFAGPRGVRPTAAAEVTAALRAPADSSIAPPVMGGVTGAGWRPDGRPGATGPGEGSGLAAARRQAWTEAARLRCAAQAPRYVRRELLADLGTRLPALLDQIPDQVAHRLRQLIADCAGDRPLALTDVEFDALWVRATEILDELAGSADAESAVRPGRGSDAQPATKESKPFWKRRSLQ